MYLVHVHVPVPGHVPTSTRTSTGPLKYGPHAKCRARPSGLVLRLGQFALVFKEGSTRTCSKCCNTGSAAVLN